MSNDQQRRFLGVQKLYGSKGYQNIQASHVCVVGIGGVGSWVVESLARTHVGEITLIDLDHIAESNINRQIHALSDTLGQAKIDAMADRVRQINSDCKLHLIDDHLSISNVTRYITHNFDYVIDCCDQFRVKAALIHYCKSNKIHCLTVGGAGGRVDPSRIQLSDMTRSEGDALLSKTRKQLRTKHGFSRNLKRRFDIPCVFSSETLRYPDCQGEITTQKSENHSPSGLNCANGFGSLCAVTSTFGMLASAYVLERLAHKNCQ